MACFKYLLRRLFVAFRNLLLFLGLGHDFRQFFLVLVHLFFPVREQISLFRRRILPILDGDHLEQAQDLLVLVVANVLGLIEVPLVRRFDMVVARIGSFMKRFALQLQRFIMGAVPHHRDRRQHRRDDGDRDRHLLVEGIVAGVDGVFRVLGMVFGSM